MKRPAKLFRAWASIGVILLILLPIRALASPPPNLQTPVSLSFAEIQITGSSEFIVLQNNTAASINIGTYWLYNHNNYNPSAAGTTTTTQQLPAAILDAGQTILLSANPQNTCGAEIAGKLSLSLTDGISSGGNGGSVELLNSSGGIVSSSDTDFVSWYKDSSADIKNLTNTSGPVYYRYQSSASPPTYAWQAAAFDGSVACQLDVAGYNAPASTSGLVAGSASPPVIFQSSATSPTSDGLPATDVGLAVPQISELLPNPAPPASDSEDEFIELYNSNTAPFDLSGFKLEVGTTSTRSYSFSAGATIEAKSFKAFFSGDTGLSLSNSGGQARLIDPSGNVVSQSDVYGSAKDGQAWVLANGVWQWTSTPTPNAENMISSPGATSKTGKNGSTSAVKSATTSLASNNLASQPTQIPATPIHPWTLAGVGAAALLYAGYEYRTDLANRIFQFRRYVEARRTIRK